MSSGSSLRHVRFTEERRSRPDRRIIERRQVQLVVPVDRRRGEARAADRRRGTAILALPTGRTIGATQSLLREAVHAVATGWSNVADEGVGREAVTGLLADIERALLWGEEPPERLRCTLGRCLLDRVRGETVRRAADTGEALRSNRLWNLMEGMEELRAALEPDWHEQFASRLAGPDGLELVVEVAHDLRSPLTSVLFLSELLGQGQSGPVNTLQRRQLGLIYSAALGLSELVGNVLDMARGGNRLTDLEPSPFSITDLMTSVGDIVRPISAEKSIEIRIAPPNSDHRLGHSVALSRVLLNLTTNALKFTQEGYVEIRARETAMSRVEFSVRDTGPGISQQALESLYSAFRPAPGQGYALSGTGLGLALCRKLVAAMGGTLEVETRENWGTRFFFELDVPPVDLL